MGTRIKLIDETRASREIADTGDVVDYGDEIELETELAERLLQQTKVWARPTSKAAKEAEGAK